MFTHKDHTEYHLFIFILFFIHIILESFLYFAVHLFIPFFSPAQAIFAYCLHRAHFILFFEFLLVCCCNLFISILNNNHYQRENKKAFKKKMKMKHKNDEEEEEIVEKRTNRRKT